MRAAREIRIEGTREASSIGQSHLVTSRNAFWKNALSEMKGEATVSLAWGRESDASLRQFMRDGEPVERGGLQAILLDFGPPVA